LPSDTFPSPKIYQNCFCGGILSELHWESLIYSAPQTTVGLGGHVTAVRLRKEGRNEEANQGKGGEKED